MRDIFRMGDMSKNLQYTPILKSKKNIKIKLFFC